MANHVNCWIEINGNDVARQQFSEFSARLESIRKKYDYGDTRAVNEGFFNIFELMKNDDDRLGGAKWAFLEEASPDQIAIVSGWDPALGLGLVVFQMLSDFDEDLIVTMKFQDQMPNFIGASLWGMKGGKIKRSDSWDVTDEFEFLDFDEYEDLSDEEVENYKSWDDAYDIQMTCLANAKANFLADKFDSFIRGYRGGSD